MKVYFTKNAEQYFYTAITVQK